MLYHHSACCEWQELDSQNFNVPQSRRRLYIIGYLDRGCAGQVLPIRCANSKAPIQLVGGTQGNRVYDPRRLAIKAGLYFIDLSTNHPRITENARCLTARYDRGVSNRSAESSGVLFIKEATKRGYKEAPPRRFCKR